MQKDLSTLLRTPLYALHCQKSAKLVDFCGYQLPVSYPLGVLQEHLHTRKAAGLFDVSHMGQVQVSGEGAAAALEAILPLDLEAMPLNQQAYTLLLNEEGGILDDLIVTRWASDCFFLVVNAACKKSDVAYLRKLLPAAIELEQLEDRALLALQGPKAAEVLRALTPDTDKLVFMQGTESKLCDTPCYITRSGYTGEDGFEISIAASEATALAETLLTNPLVALIGLGARDSLRLEAGLCLYGQDMNEQTTAVEAALNFAIGKARRSGAEKAGGFPGAEVVLSQLAAGAKKKRCGLMVEGRAPIRAGVTLQTLEGEPVGTVSSGGFGPSIERPVAMGYVDTEHSKPGTPLMALLRGKALPVTVVKTPFVPQRYFRG